MRAGGVCDPGESEWEAQAWKTEDIIAVTSKTQTDNVNDGNEISLVSCNVRWQHQSSWKCTDFSKQRGAHECQRKAATFNCSHISTLKQKHQAVSEP